MTSLERPVVLLEDGDEEEEEVETLYEGMPNVAPTKIEELINLAEYEINQDPYRGMEFLGITTEKEEETNITAVSSNPSVSRNSINTGERNKFISPWDICQFGVISSKNKNKQRQDYSFELNLDNANKFVQCLTDSSCPSLLAWTKQSLKGNISDSNKKRTRKRIRYRPSPVTLAHRPSDVHFRCPCDSNPFCLASLGGFMNQLLTERSQNGVTVAIDCDNENNVSHKELMSNDRKKDNFHGIPKLNRRSDNTLSTSKVVDITCFDSLATCNEVVVAKTGYEDNKVFTFMAENDEVKTKKKYSSTVKSIITCKPLERNRSKPMVGDPAEVFQSEGLINNQHLNETEYSITTKDEIDTLRNSQEIDISAIRNHANKIFEVSNCSKMSMEEYIRDIEEWNKSLIFVNPINVEHEICDGHMMVASPPGIQNLGATCYLNTQLQCLAQNPVFINGIFSWRAVNSSHNMNGVMTKLQTLLAQLLVGADRKYTSLDFSNALGLQHNEQQDPNEFARLLFDRMEESFQQCSNDVEENDLSGLLQRIFHGTTTYETTCMECGKSSVRSEGFMDLNLPIVRRQRDTEDKYKSKGCNKMGDDVSELPKRKRRKKVSKKYGDTDVQYCLDQYTKAEILEGDNKYYCDFCKCKQNAKRVMKLTKLPPVLNVQLSRYVFDREKLIKKKLMDKVGLPTVLYINQSEESCSSDSKSEFTKKKFILVAVMRHKGTSCYSGHYVAEALDWSTGIWYEFNDETVKVLAEPSSSHVQPSSSDESMIDDDFDDDDDKSIQNIKKFFISTEGTKASNNGSQDAYNMYYVDEEYFAKKTIDVVHRRKGFGCMKSGASHGELNDIHDDDALCTIIREKEKKYKILTELCYKDYVVSDRLRRRKNGIQKYMFMDPTSLLAPKFVRDDNDESYFWVDGDALRLFLACDRSLDEKLRSNKPIVCPQNLLCSHGHLHPRNARQGKLLRKSLYDSYVSLLKGELKFMFQKSEVKDSDVVGCVIAPNKNMICVECSELYRNELTEKLELIKNVYSLYYSLVKDKTTYQYEPKFVKRDRDFWDDKTGEECLYILAKTSVTAFKNHVEKMIKLARGFDGGGNLVLAQDNSFFCNGIDNFDILSFLGELDDKFNTKLACPHGNCNEFKMNYVRYVPYRIWNLVKNVFPNAIELKLVLHKDNDVIRKPSIEYDGCDICRQEIDATNNLILHIKDWSRNTKSNSELEKVLDEKRFSGSEIEIHNFETLQDGCRLVHCDDIANLFKVSKSLSKKLSGKSFVDLKTLIENKAFPSYHSVVLDFEKLPNKKLFQSIRPLICREHKLAIKNAIIDCSNMDSDSRKKRLSNFVTVLLAEEYHAYISSLTELLRILNRDYHKLNHMESSLQDNDSSLLDEVKSIADFYHPIIKMNAGQDTSPDEVLTVFSKGDSKEFLSAPGICECQTCIREFVPKKAHSDLDDPAESVSDESNVGENNGLRKSTEYKRGSAAGNAIVVESDADEYCTKLLGNTQKIKVFQYNGGSELKDALQSLRSAAGLVASEDYNDHDFGLRRSKRKRKPLYPIGCINLEKSVNIGMHHNIAALRLLLFQHCEIHLGCKISIAVTLDDVLLPKGLEITFDMNEKSFQDVINKIKDLDGISEISASNLSNNVFILYENDNDVACGDFDATAMDSLLEISNIVHPDSERKSGNDKRKRASERGFLGTLLHRSPAVESDAQNSTISFDESSCQIEVPIEVNQKDEENQPSIAVEISEDEIEESLSDCINVEEVTLILNDARTMEIGNKLREIANTKDESACYKAASWAIDHSEPGCCNSEIIDSALAKFLNDTNT